MNNKGFAISALVYGLVIMGILIVAMLMKTVSSTRENQKLLSEMIEDELNNLGMSSSAFVPVAGDEGQVFTAQEAGLYRIELWGAAGANGSGGKGSYTSGVIYLEEGQSLFFFIGQSTASGGHETDVRLNSNDGYDGHNSYETRIMVAGGGGKNADADGKGLVRSDTLKLNPPSLEGVVDGGHGYIPGATATDGGSSFISGYGGSQAIIKGLGNPNDPTYRYNENTGVVGNTYQYDSRPDKKYYFVDGLVIPGVNTGAGKATIRKIGNDINKIKNETVVASKIEICNNNTETPFTASSINTVKISAIGDATSDGGQNFTSDNDSLAGGCLSNTFTAKTIDEVTISGLEQGNKYKVTITTSEDNIVFNNITPSSSGEFRYSTYQSRGSLPRQSNYYIQSVSGESTFLTYADDEIKPQLLTGNKNQIWEITKVSNTPDLYKIVEMSKFNAMSSNTENTVNNITEIESREYNAISQDKTQLFKIKYNSDGTYSIVPQSGSDANQAIEITNEGLIVKAKDDNKQEQKFRLITIDYSK